MRNSDGTFGKNNSGRPKGSVNKSSNEIRETFQLLLVNNIEKIQEDLNELEPKDRIKLLLDLSNYILPKLRSIDLQSDIEETITIDFNESIGWDKTDEEN